MKDMEKVEIPKELYGEIKRVVKLIGFEDINEFVAAAARRLLDRYEILLSKT